MCIDIYICRYIRIYFVTQNISALFLAVKFVEIIYENNN